jgi:hypothetical protein
MADTEKAPAPPGTAPATPTPPKRSPGHRGADVKDTVAEMAAKAHEISLEAGSKMAAAMKDVVNAAAGLSGFVLESARDLVQYMVRRGQMTQEEADKLIREVEAFQPKRKGPAPAPPSAKAGTGDARKVASPPAASRPPATHVTHPTHPTHAKAPAKTPASRPPAKKAAAKPAAKKPAAKKPAAKKPAAKKPAAKPAAKKPMKKSAGKARARSSAKAKRR